MKKATLKIYGTGRLGSRLYTFKTTDRDYKKCISRLSKSGMIIRAAYLNGTRVL